MIHRGKIKEAGKAGSLSHHQSGSAHGGEASGCVLNQDQGFPGPFHSGLRRDCKPVAMFRTDPLERSFGFRSVLDELTGSIGSSFALAETLSRATPLIFTGLAAAVAFRARFWNIGAEGQLYAGALMVTFSEQAKSISMRTSPPILFMEAVAGSLWLFLLH